MNKNMQEQQITDKEWAQFKRVMEMYAADPTVRRRLTEDAKGFICDSGFELEPELVKEAIAMKYQWNPDEQRVWENPYYREFIRRNRKISEIVLKKSAPERFADKKMQRWNQMVTMRLRMENRDLRLHPNIMYYPVNFELGDGCRIQCPFCGLAAPKWKANFLYTEENRELWREVLQVVKKEIGVISSAGICYFATEPMDNPDYEKFLADFAAIMGDYPQTTTSVAERYPERIRGLMKQIGNEGLQQAAIRFSARTLSQFYRILEEYSPLELKDIEIVPNNPESDCCYSASGRILEQIQDYPPEKLNKRYSISCIAGFQINMVKKTVTFMEPEIPEERFPKGIREYETRTFENAQDLVRIIKELSEQWVRWELPQDMPLRWNPYIRIMQEANRVIFEGDHIQCKMSGNRYFYDSIALIHQGKSVKEVCQILNIGDFIAEELKMKLNLLYQKGYLRYEQ